MQVTQRTYSERFPIHRTGCAHRIAEETELVGTIEELANPSSGIQLYVIWNKKERPELTSSGGILHLDFASDKDIYYPLWPSYPLFGRTEIVMCFPFK